MHGQPSVVAGGNAPHRPIEEGVPRPARCRDRAPLAGHEWCALWVVGVAVVGFAVHGIINEVPGTLEYVFTVSGLATLLFACRRQALPAPIAIAAAASAVVHLAGGLVQVGDGVLYNASPGPELLRYDHAGHALGTFVGAQLVWELLMRDVHAATRRGPLVAVTVLAALGLGALNEAVEFVTTLTNGGSHVGGYTNTGWDLVTNTFAGMLAGVVIHRRRHAALHVDADHRAATAA